MRLTTEQELAFRTVLAQRVAALKSPYGLSQRNEYRDGWNEALERAVEVLMGGDPVSIPEQLARRKNGALAPVEDLELPEGGEG